MSKIQIGTAEHRFCDASESWIHQQVQERQKDGQPVCARVILKNHSVDLLLSTPQCSRGHGGGRKPNEREEEIFRFWENEHLNEPNWTAGNLFAFVRRVHHLVC
jgi:hypothetical protein